MTAAARATKAPAGGPRPRTRASQAPASSSRRRVVTCPLSRSSNTGGKRTANATATPRRPGPSLAERPLSRAEAPPRAPPVPAPATVLVPGDTAGLPVARARRRTEAGKEKGRYRRAVPFARRVFPEPSADSSRDRADRPGRRDSRLKSRRADLSPRRRGRPDLAGRRRAASPPIMSLPSGSHWRNPVDGAGGVGLGRPRLTALQSVGRW